MKNYAQNCISISPRADIFDIVQRERMTNTPKVSAPRFVVAIVTTEHSPEIYQAYKHRHCYAIAIGENAEFAAWVRTQFCDGTTTITHRDVSRL